MEAKRSHEEKFVDKKLKMIAEIEGSLKTVRKRLKVSLQSGQATTEDGKKLVESLVVYGEILCGYHEQALIGNCVKTLASLHSVYENMTSHLNEAMRGQLIPIIDQLLLLFKGAKESKSKVNQSRVGYERAAVTASKNPASDKTIQTLGDSKREWERVTEMEMQRLCRMAEEHSLASSAAFSNILADYINLFAVANEFCTAISPDLEEFLAFARDRQASRVLDNQVKHRKEDDLRKAKIDDLKKAKIEDTATTQKDEKTPKEEKHKRKFLQRPAMKKLSEVKKEHLDLKRMKSKLDISIEGLSKDSSKDGKDGAKDSKDSAREEKKDREAKEVAHSGGGGERPKSAEEKKGKGHQRSDTTAMDGGSSAPSSGGQQMEENISVEEFEDTDSITFVVTPGVAVPAVRTATVPKLVERLTHVKYPDILFREAFMVTYRSFTTPEEVLRLLMARYLDETADMSARVKLRVLATVKYWLESHPYDFVEDKDLAGQLHDFIESTISATNKTAGKQLLNAYNRVMNHKGDISALIRKTSVSAEAAPEPRIPAGLTEDTIGLRLLDAKETARQLTIIESELYCAITPKECLNKSWSSKRKEELAPNILGMITRFNLTSGWVITEVVQKVRLEQRVEVLRKFIRIAACLRKLNNFNGVMEIIAGINNSAVRRLKSTWAELDETELTTIRELEQELNHKGNYKVYRDLLRQSTPPIIPYLGIYLTDLTFIEDGNPDTIDGLVNFSKRQKIARVVESIQRYQSPYNFQKVDVVQKWLSDITILSEEEAYAMSTKVEPRDTSEALEKMLVEEHRMRKAVRELQVKNEEYEAQEVIQNNTISLLSRQLREQQKMLSDMKKALSHTQYAQRRATAGTTWAPLDSSFKSMDGDIGKKLAMASEMARSEMQHRVSISQVGLPTEMTMLLAKIERQRASSVDSTSDTEDVDSCGSSDGSSRRSSVDSCSEVLRSDSEESFGRSSPSLGPQEEKSSWGTATPTALSSPALSRAPASTLPAPVADVPAAAAAEIITTLPSGRASPTPKSSLGVIAVQATTASGDTVVVKADATHGMPRITPKRPAPQRQARSGSPSARGQSPRRGAPTAGEPARDGTGRGDGGGRGAVRARGDRRGRGAGPGRGRGRGAPGRPHSPAPAIVPAAASPEVLRKAMRPGQASSAAAVAATTPTSPAVGRAKIVRVTKSPSGSEETQTIKESPAVAVTAAKDTVVHSPRGSAFSAPVFAANTPSVAAEQSPRVNSSPETPSVAIEMSEALTPEKRQCRALFDFVAENPDELNFRKGDILTVIDTENAEAETGEGWWIGELDGRRGFFQADYVKML